MCRMPVHLSSPSRSCDNAKCPQILPNVCWGPKLPLVENDWPGITVVLLPLCLCLLFETEKDKMCPNNKTSYVIDRDSALFLHYFLAKFKSRNFSSSPKLAVSS